MMRKIAPQSSTMGSGSRDGIRYHRMTASGNDGFVDMQFEKPPSNIPWRAIILAVVLCVVGTILLIVGSLLVSGHIDSKYGDRTWPLIVLGLLMFIPGAYHVRLAYYAFQGYSGYSFDDIPEFN